MAFLQNQHPRTSSTNEIRHEMCSKLLDLCFVEIKIVLNLSPQNLNFHEIEPIISIHDTSAS